MMLLNLRITLLAVIVFFQSIHPSSNDLLPSIVWDPFNPLFNCTSANGGHLVINVRPMDLLNLLCPHQTLISLLHLAVPNNEELYENLYLLGPSKRNDFLSCNTDAGKLILDCNEPDKLKFHRFSFKEHFGSSSSAFVFKPGKDYFLIGSGKQVSGDIRKKTRGSCIPGNKGRGFPLKLQIHVCSWKEIHHYKNCSICSNYACYFKGCTVSGDWRTHGTYKKLVKLPTELPAGNIAALRAPDPQTPQCMTLQKRLRHNHALGLSFSDTRFQKTSCPLSTPDCTTWIKMDSTVYNGQDGACFRLFKRSCKVNSIKSPMEQVKRETTPCRSKVLKPDKEEFQNRTQSENKSQASRILYVCVIPLTTFLIGLILGFTICICKGNKRVIVVRKKMWQSVYKRDKCVNDSRSGSVCIGHQPSTCSSGLLPLTGSEPSVGKSNCSKECSCGSSRLPSLGSEPSVGNCSNNKEYAYGSSILPSIDSELSAGKSCTSMDEECELSLLPSTGTDKECTSTEGGCDVVMEVLSEYDDVTL